MNDPEYFEDSEHENSVGTEPAIQPPGHGRHTPAGETSSARLGRRYAVAVVVLRGLRLYGLIACLGVVITMIIRPDLLGSPLSAWWPDVDRGVLGAFGILLSCVAWTCLKFLDRPHRRRDDD